MNARKFRRRKWNEYRKQTNKNGGVALTFRKWLDRLKEERHHGHQ